MLPDYINENERYRFVCDGHRGFFLLLVRDDMLARAEPFVPLWARECADRPTLDALCRWASVRRARWQSWGELAEALGHVGFMAYMDELFRAEPPAHVTGTLIRQEDDPCVIALGQTLSGGPVAGEVLMRHRFDTPEARRRFLELLHASANCYPAEEAVRLAFEHGTRFAGEMLDGLAAKAAAAEPRRRVKVRRRRRSEA